jgi:hypothetical protein
MSPSTGTSVCSLLPSRGSRFSPVPHAPRYYEVVRLLPARPDRLRSPSTARYLTVECPFVPRASAFDQPGPGPLRSGAPYLLCSGGDGRSPRFLGNPCERVPRARDSGGSQRPRRTGRPDAVFRQANGVDIRHGNDFGAEPSRPASSLPTLHPHQSPGERQGSLPACPLRLWPGWTLTSWIPSRGFCQLMLTSPSPRLSLARY